MPERIALTLEPTATLCTRCDEVILNIEEAFVRDSEVGAPYEIPLYCSAECRNKEDEDEYERVYSNWPNNCTCNGDFCGECLERRRRERQ